MKTIRSNRTARVLVKQNVHCQPDMQEWILARQCGVWMRRHAYQSAIRLATKRGLITTTQETHHA